MDDPLAALRHAVLADIAADRGPRAWLRSRSRLVRTALVLAVAAAEIGLVAWFLLRPDMAFYPAGQMLATATLYAALVATATWSALRPLHRPPARRLQAAMLLAGAVIPAILAVLAPIPTDSEVLASPPWSRLLICAGNGLILALPVLLLLAAVDRHGAPFATLLPPIAGGIVAVLGLQMHCPINEELHLVLGHATLPALLLLGVALFRRG